MKIHGCLRLFLGAMSLCVSSFAWSSCAISQESGVVNALKSYTIPLSATIAVPPDIPVGREIYRLKISLANYGATKVVCTSLGQFYTAYSYLTKPSPVSTYSSTVYQTGLPGIGVKFTRGNNLADFPSTLASTNCINYTECHYDDGWNAESRLILIKTASTVTPGTILASKLPSAVYSFGQSGSMPNIYKVTLTGSLNITTPTCNITAASQSMTVNMGQHRDTEFTGKGTGSGWKNASIELNNCGQFYGNTQPGYTSGTLSGAGFAPGNLLNNYLSVTLTPLNGTASATDAANGIMNIDEHPNKAGGVGIQLSSSENTSGVINLASGISQNLPRNGASAVTIPIYARYIQTGDSVSAGVANGKLEYTITYQ